MTTYRDLVPTKLAAGIWNYLTKYKTSIANFPQTETCELLVLDRSVDQVFEWGLLDYMLDAIAVTFYMLSVSSTFNYSDCSCHT